MLCRNEIIEILKGFKESITEERLNKYWSGFKVSPIALYTSDEVFLIGHNNPPEEFEVYGDVYIGKWDKKFTGNTIILFNGEYTAIWDMELSPSPFILDRLFSGIVHEIFHTYQFKIGYEKYPNECLFIKYPFIKENIEYRIEERKALLKSIFANSEFEKKKNLSRFIALREKRKEIIGKILEYELGMESLEGSAIYVECKALTEENNIPKEFALSYYGRDLYDYSDMLFNFRKSCYSSGMLMCELLDTLNIDWHDEYIKGELYLYDFLKSKVQYDNELIEVKDFMRAEKLIDEYDKSKKQQIDDFFKSSGEKSVIQEDMKIKGFDPMNVVSLDNMVLHKHFLKVHLDGKEVFFKGPVLTKHDKDFFNIEELIFFPESNLK